MADKILDYPILSYITFALPAVLLLLGIIFSANVFLMILTISWLGIAFMILFLPLASDDGTNA
jgi:hypothetical protein